jgi:hypothetical protein
LNQFGLFDPAPVATSELKNCAIRQSDVLRIVQHKEGAFRELRAGQLTGREFRFVELRDGTWCAEFTDDGERRSTDVRSWIEIGFAQGTLVEVTG